MTAPVRQDVTFEEIAAASETKEPVKAADIKLEAEDLPEDIKGKTAADIAQLVDGLKKSLLQSEAERQRLASQPAPTAPAAPAPAPAAPEPPPLTDEQLTTLYQEKPLDAIRYMTEQANKRAEANWDRRITQLVGGTIDSARAEAQRKYSEEFQLFGDQIDEMLKQIPNAQAMASGKAWDDLVSYIRGQPQNIEKLIEHRTAKSKAAVEAAAREEQVALAGVSVPSAVRTPAPKSGSLDALELEIAKNLNMTPQDYAKWKSLG